MVVFSCSWHIYYCPATIIFPLLFSKNACQFHSNNITAINCNQAHLCVDTLPHFNPTMSNCYSSILGIYWNHRSKIAPYVECKVHWYNSNASLSPAIFLQQNMESCVAYVALQASLLMYWTHGNVQLNMLSQSLAWLNNFYYMQMVIFACCYPLNSICNPLCPRTIHFNLWLYHFQSAWW